MKSNLTESLFANKSTVKFSLLDIASWIGRACRHKSSAKAIEVNGETVVFAHLCYRSRQMEIWCESERAKKLLNEMPYANTVHQVFEAYKKESKLKFRYLLITDESAVADNWLFEKEWAWVVTLSGVLLAVQQFLERKNVNLYFFYRYLRKHGISL